MGNLTPDLKDFRERLNKTVAHLTLTRGSDESISDKALADGINAIWPAIQDFQKHLDKDLLGQVTDRLGSQQKAWKDFQDAYPDTSESTSDGSWPVEDIIFR